MSTEIVERPAAQVPAKQRSQGQIFRDQTHKYAFALLVEWVGEERAKQAAGRIAVAMSAAAASSKDPSAFYNCTPQSVATCTAIAALTNIMPSTGSGALAYVVPQPPRKDEPPVLQYNLSHRGINALASRCNRTMIAVPVGMSDVIEFADDMEVTNLVTDVDDPPITFEELRGIVIIVKQIDNGVVITRRFMPKKLIEPRRAMSRSWNSEKGRKYSPWFNWPVEMSIKTAMHYAISRGWCVIDDTEAVRALSVDVESDLAQPLLPAPEIESRNEAVANLLCDEPAEVVTISEESGVVATATETDLQGSLLARIADCETRDELDSIKGEIEALGWTRKDSKVLTEALNAKWREVSGVKEGASP